MIDSSIIGVKNLKDADDIGHLFNRLYKSDLARDFGVHRLSLENLRVEIQKHMVEHRLSALFYNTITCDEIMHPGLHTDQIEAIVLGIMQRLDGVRHLLIIDPYFYDDNPTSLTLLEKVVASMASLLKRVTIITNGSRANKRTAMHTVPEDGAGDLDQGQYLG